MCSYISPFVAYCPTTRVLYDILSKIYRASLCIYEKLEAIKLLHWNIGTPDSAENGLRYSCIPLLSVFTFLKIYYKYTNYHMKQYKNIISRVFSRYITSKYFYDIIQVYACKGFCKRVSKLNLSFGFQRILHTYINIRATT